MIGLSSATKVPVLTNMRPQGRVLFDARPLANSPRELNTGTDSATLRRQHLRHEQLLQVHSPDFYNIVILGCRYTSSSHSPETQRLIHNGR